MQNKGFITFFAVMLTLVCLFYLSFTLVTSKYYTAAKEYAAGDPVEENHYLDSLSTQKVWLGYTLKKSRTMELNLGLDLKGGMSVIMEVSEAEILRSLSNNSQDPIFNQALAAATERQAKGSKDYIALFVDEYHRLDPGARLSAIFSTFELKEKINPQFTDDQVVAVLRAEVGSAIDNSFNVLRTRIDRFGVVAPNIQRIESEGRISIELPGIKEPERVRALLQGSANLEFWETFEEQEIHQALLAANTIIRDSIARVTGKVEETTDAAADAATEAKTPEAKVTDDATEEVKDSTELAENDETEAEVEKEESIENYKKEYPLFALLNTNPQQSGRGPVVGIVNKSDMAQVDRYLSMRQVKDALPRSLNLKWSVKPSDEGEVYYQLVALKTTTRDGKAPLEGDVVTDANAEASHTSSFFEVSMRMNRDGAKKWARLTKDNIDKSVAIVLDDHVYSFPKVSQEITGGVSSITGNFTPEEAKDLANVLKSGKMSAPAHIVQEDVVGPSLGQESINKGLISFFFALIVLMSYLIFMYGWKPGLIADGALFLNLFFTLGFLVSFHAVLTLSGIAGVVLALAMAVDANVLIYERIKEELRGGKTLKSAIAEGYDKAFSAIFDSNLTSIITGVILFIFGTGPIRGFATTLIFGILISFFTAVYLTHVFYSYFLEKGKLTDLKFTTKMTENFLINMNFDFLKKKKLVYGINIGVIVVCLLALGLRGLNQGIDFTGGRNYVVRFEQPVNTVDAQELLDPLFEDNSPNVITLGSANQVRISTNYKIADSSEGVEEEITRKLYDGFKPLLKDGTTYEKFNSDYIQSSQKVGPTIAEDIKTGAIWAVILSVLGIGLYILIRFKDISYSVGSIAALTADAIFILGVYALFWGFLPFSMEADQTFIGAVLTAIGYSINDKVVIFDRVREYSHLYPKRSKYELFNEALNSTLDRTFNTGMCTLIVLIIIFFFAGETIRSFSFAMLLGLIIGTISSLFTGAPIAYEIQNRKALKNRK